MTVKPQRFTRYVQRDDVYIAYDTVSMRKYILRGAAFDLLHSLLRQGKMEMSSDTLTEEDIERLYRLHEDNIIIIEAKNE